MIWHKCFNGDYPEDHCEDKEIRVLAYDSSGEYSVQLREYNAKLDGYIWNSDDKNIVAWTEIEPYTK